MPLNLAMIAEIKAFFLKEREEELGDLAAIFILSKIIIQINNDLWKKVAKK